MAILTGPFQFTGSLGEYSVYRIKGSDKLVVRRKGGPTKRQLQTGDNHAILRKHQEEMKGCVEARKSISLAVHPLKHLADFKYTGTLNGICKRILTDDTEHVLGQRAVLFSRSAYKLEGFSFNKVRPLESFVNHPLHYAIDKPSAVATVQLPSIIPGINFNNPRKWALYRFVFVLGVLPDMLYDEQLKRYASADKIIFPATANAKWHTWKESMAAQEINIQLEPPALSVNYSLVLAAGIEFGMPDSNTVVKSIKGDGAVKIVLIR